MIIIYRFRKNSTVLLFVQTVLYNAKTVKIQTRYESGYGCR